MVQFLDLPRQRSTGEKLMQGLGLAAQSIPDMIGAYEKSKSLKKIGDTLPKEQKDIWDSLDVDTQTKLAPGIFTSIRQKDTAMQKNIDESRKFLGSSLPKSVYNKFGDKIDPIYKENLRKGMTRDEAREDAWAQVKAGEKGGSSWMDLLGFPGALFKGGQAQPAAPGTEQGAEETPSAMGNAWDFLTRERSQDPESALRKGMSGDLERAGRAAQALLPTGVGLAEQAASLGLLPLAQQKSPRLTPRELLANEKPFKSEKYFNTPSEMIAEKLMEGMTPEQKQQFQEDMMVQGIAATVAGLAAGARPKGPGAISPTEVLPPERAAPKALTNRPTIAQTPSKAAPKPVVPKEKAAPAELKGRVTEAPETATEMRVERAKPEERIYPRLENVELREKQLKNFPKYVEEINTDAAERAARAEKREPKTVKGRQSQQIRIHEAEKKYLIAQESYNKAAGRVRALEDEVVKLKGETREAAETLLELARKDLDDATFNLKQAYENLTGVNVRAGIEEMRTAARNKMQQIQDAIAAEEEYKIAKMDYSPDLIAKANAISKSKPLPKARQSDFYTQVHDVYANEYRNRVSEIDKELKELPKTMAGMSKARHLQQEKDILNKMIKSAEAEKTIQNRRFGLREMAERHKAQERFKKLQKDGAKPEVSKVAQEKMWKGRMEEAKTAEERAAVVDDAVEQVANEQPEKAARIRDEGEKLKDSIENLFKPRESKAPPSVKGEKTRMGDGHKKPPPPPPEAPSAGKGAGIPSKEEILGKPKSAAEAAKNGLNYLRDIQKKIDDMLSKIPIIGKYWFVRDMIFGAVSVGFDLLHKETDFPFTGADAVSVIAGRPGYGGLRHIARKFGKEATKWGIKWFKELMEVRSYLAS